MRGKSILILLGLCAFLLTSILLACTSKEPEPAFKDPGRAAAKPPTPEEQFKKAIAPFVVMLNSAQILEEGQTVDNPMFANIKAIRDKLAGGTPLADVDLTAYNAKMEGPFPGIKPADVHETFVKLLDGLAPGKPSKIIWAEGLGFGIVYLVSRDEESGMVEVAIIAVGAAGTTTTESAEGATSTQTPSGLSTTGG